MAKSPSARVSAPDPLEASKILADDPSEDRAVSVVLGKKDEPEAATAVDAPSEMAPVEAEQAVPGVLPAEVPPLPRYRLEKDWKGRLDRRPVSMKAGKILSEAAYGSAAFDEMRAQGAELTQIEG